MEGLSGDAGGWLTLEEDQECGESGLETPLISLLISLLPLAHIVFGR